ncbi:hypothetical protein ACN4EK_28175 [Pantanalinema rosaneae CENA516]|uniref:hypothetical protein n=1 Tax=Pantanalinema rosaneae TaxID=1620701 RepID=UPI003D6FCAF3
MTYSSDNQLDSKVELLIDQVGRLTEGMVEYRLQWQAEMADFRSGLSEFRTEMREGLSEFRTEMQQSMTEFRADMAELKATTQRQAETVDRLVRIVETLIERKDVGV